MKHGKRGDLLVRYGLMLLMSSTLFLATSRSAQSQTAQPPTAQSEAMAPQERDDITLRQLADFGQFLDRHPEVADQLRKDPSLVNNQEFIERHPELRDYLQQHPEIRTELSQNPNGFMREEERFDRREDQDPNRRQLADIDEFLNHHPEVAEQLRKDPSLVNNREFVENHPAFQQFLSEHPEIRTEFKDHPDAFMRDAERFDHHDDFNVARNRNGGGELSSFNQFLEGHSNIAGELSRNPSLANNQEYLESHPELQAYLQANPQVHEQLNQNPQVFVQSAQQLNTHGTVNVEATPKPKQ